MKASSRTPVVSFLFAVPLAIAVLITLRAVELYRAWKVRR